MSSQGKQRPHVRGAFRPPSITPLLHSANVSTNVSPTLSHSASVSATHRRPNTRWTEAMDMILINTLIDETISGGRTSDNGWKTTALQHVVDEVTRQVLRPDLPPITKDNVRVRLKTMKSTYNSAKNLISLSGFSYDPETFCITGDSSAWDDYIVAHPDAANYRGKPLPYYNDWAVIVGNDTATGAGAMDGFETATLSSPITPRTNLDDIDDEGNIEFGTGGSNCYTEEDVPVADPSPTTKRAKKSKLTDIQEMRQVLMDLVAASNRIADAFTTINYGELYEALHALPNLSEQQCLAAYKFFSTDKEAAKAFLGCPNNALKFGLVHLYLYGTFSPPSAEPTTFSSATNEVDE